MKTRPDILSRCGLWTGRRLCEQAVPPRSSFNAFSLFELLVVIGIIGLLAALLLPSLSRSKGVAQSTVCKRWL